MQANQMLEMYDRMLGFDAMMAGKFKEEIGQLKQLIKDWDARSSIVERERDLSVREGVLVKQKQEFAGAQEGHQADMQKREDKLTERQGEIQASLTTLSEHGATVAADQAKLSAERAAFAKESEKERSALREDRRDLELRSLEVENLRKKLAIKEDEIKGFQDRMSALAKG